MAFIIARSSWASLAIVAALAVAAVWAFLPRSTEAGALTVTNLDDSGAGSLRAAMEQATATAGADTITFSVSGTIMLATFLPSVTDAAGLTIDGSGQNVTVSGNHAVRPFIVMAGAGLHLKSIAIADGDAGAGPAGAIYNGGNLTLTGATVTGNKAVLGAGIASFGGALTITNSTISSNEASNSGGGVLGRPMPTSQSRAARSAGTMPRIRAPESR